MMYKEDFLHLIAEQKMKEMLAEAEHMAMVKEAGRARREAARQDKPGPFPLFNIFILIRNFFYPAFKQL